jgi:formiminoglutamase
VNSTFAFIFVQILIMDIRHYFNPVNFLKLPELCTSKYSLGRVIKNFTSKLTISNIKNIEVVIIGVPIKSGNKGKDLVESPDIIREELYQLTDLNDKLNIVDFGNLKEAKSQKGTYLALRDVIEYFNELNITTIVIGGSQDLTVGICDAFKNERFFTLAVIDALLDVKKGKETFGQSNFLTRIFKTNLNLFQFSLLAYQSHFVASEQISKTKGIGEHLRLGLLRDDLTEAEPIIRNAHVLSFDIGAIKYIEAPGRSIVTPNGLRGEEACQLAKYAGSSSRLKVFGLFEADAQKDKSGLTVKLSAQIIWYFLNGYTTRQIEKIESVENKIIYKVEVKDVDKPLVFYKHSRSNRWWLEIELLSGEKVNVACSEREYRLASNNDIPELWLKYVQKIDSLSK